jgi:hypothetical protein
MWWLVFCLRRRLGVIANIEEDICPHFLLPIDPAPQYITKRNRVEAVPAFSPFARDDQQPGAMEHAQVLHDRETPANAVTSSPVVRGRWASRSSIRRRVRSASALKTRSVRAAFTCDQKVTYYSDAVNRGCLVPITVRDFRSAGPLCLATSDWVAHQLPSQRVGSHRLTGPR